MCNVICILRCVMYSRVIIIIVTIIIISNKHKLDHLAGASRAAPMDGIYSLRKDERKKIEGYHFSMGKSEICCGSSFEPLLNDLISVLSVLDTCSLSL